MLGCGYLASAAQADVKDFYYRRYLANQFPSSTGVLDSDPEPKNAFFEQKIDHDTPSDSRIYKQRYFTDSSYASTADAPVILYLCGEANCTADTLGDTVRAHAKKKLRAYGGA